MWRDVSVSACHDQYIYIYIYICLHYFQRDVWSLIVRVACSFVSGQKLKGSASCFVEYVYFENSHLAKQRKMKRCKSEDIGTDLSLIWCEGWRPRNWVCVQTFPRYIEQKNKQLSFFRNGFSLVTDSQSGLIKTGVRMPLWRHSPFWVLTSKTSASSPEVKCLK